MSAELSSRKAVWGPGERVLPASMTWSTRHGSGHDTAAANALLTPHTIELALDTAHAEAVAPVWSALLTGSADAQGRGTISEDIRDATWRVPILWFQETEEHETPRQRFHLDVQVPDDVADQRIAAALAAGGVVVHDSDPSYVVIADPDGNKACVARYPHPA